MDRPVLEDEYTTCDVDGTVVEEYQYNCPNCNLDGIIALCKEKEEKLNLAGEVGLRLHEELQKSQRHMDEVRVQHEAQVEGMIQESYELKIKLESMENLMDDQKAIMKQTVDDFKIWKERSVRESNEKSNEFKKERASSLAQLNEIQLRERQLNEKLRQLEQQNVNLIAEKQKKQDQLNVSYSHEMFVLNEKVIDMENVVDDLTADNVKLRNENEMLSLSLQTIQVELINKQAECEAAESKCTSYCNYLEKSHEETSEVKAELEALKTKLKQSGHLSKGNSLFGEVEDERMVMEKKLKTMEVKYESIKKAYGFIKTQHHNLKSQVAALLSLHSGKADLDYVRNIERALSQVKSENAKLVSRLKETQCNEETDEISNPLYINELAKNLPNFESNEDVIEFLTTKLEISKSQLKKLHEELDHTHMIKMAESDKLLTAEQKLHETGIIGEKYKNANMKLRLKLEEAEDKYKAENQKRILIEEKFNYDSSNDVDPIGVTPKLKNFPPSFKKCEQSTVNFKKFSKATEKKMTSKETLSSDNWSDVLKILQESRDKNKCKENKENAMPLPTVRKIIWSEDSDAFISPDKNTLCEDQDNLFSSESKVMFEDDKLHDTSSTKKENDCKVDVDIRLKTEMKNPSCLKKTYASKSRESSVAKPKDRNIKLSGMQVKDDKPCDVQ